jgi:UDP-N-acetylglucosamine--N-acetylmuramyl-(pentapeptide) pyrophosphoryl-undecaprenol N-acetylglucosamine transferase
VVHQTGERDFPAAEAAYSSFGTAVEVYRFIDDMPGFFSRADLILCRSGASTVAEITAAGKPAVFVPFPRAADDHQRRNAEALQHAGAAVMLEESYLNAASLIETISGLFGDPARLRAMSVAARKLSHPSAARDIATMAASLAGVQSGV